MAVYKGWNQQRTRYNFPLCNMAPELEWERGIRIEYFIYLFLMSLGSAEINHG